MPLIDVRGIGVHAVCLGEGPPVVMVHGLLVGSLAQWYFTTAPALAPKHRVVLYDLRGHGRSERPGTGYDLPTLAADLAGLLAALAIDGPVDLVGHSYGALVALHYARTHPVRRLVLVDAPLPPSDAGVFAATPAELVDALPDGIRLTRRRLAALAALTADTTLLADIAAEPDLDDDALAEVACPTLCLYGERSACLPAGERLARVLPDATLRTLPAGHFAPVEVPGAVTGAVVEFLDG